MNTNEDPKKQLLLAQQYATGELEAECDDEVFRQCKLVEGRGGAKVLYFTGMCYHYGWGIVKDLKATIQCYVRAAELGSFEALKQLYDLRNDQSMKANLQNAFSGFCKKVDQGDARAQFNAGYCYFYEIGIPRDKAKARDLFQMAADQGCADAMWMLEKCRQSGVGDGCNGMSGAELLKYAAEMGSVQAQYELGCAYCSRQITYDLEVEQDYKQAVEWFQKAADQNHAEATCWLAWCYCYRKGVQKNVKRALQLYKKAALMGDGSAQDIISDFYRHGYSSWSEDEWPVGIDYYEAAYWNRKAVGQGYDLNQGILKAIELAKDQIDKLKKQTSSFKSAKTWYNIAKQYETGDGVEKDEQEAFQIYRLAARLGSIQAKPALGRCYKQGIGTDVDTQQAIHWYEKAAMQGHNKAAKSLLSIIQSKSTNNGLKTESSFIALAECYEIGNGVPRNIDTALLMREHAVANGDIEQAKIVIETYMSGKGSEYRIRNVSSIISKTPGLPSKDYQQFIDQFQNSIDELDKLQILQHIAAAIRVESMGINIIFE